MPFLTIVFTDVVASSATKRDVSLGRDSRERDHAYLENIQRRHFSLVRECCRAYSGCEVSNMGDAFYLTFEDPVAAVRCAAEIQKRLLQSPIDTPQGPLRLRIGIHSGFPESFEGGWQGTDVDTAARVEATATERQILLSSSTYELVRHMTDMKFHACGKIALKGVERMALWEALWDDKGPRALLAEPSRLGAAARSALRYQFVRRFWPAVAACLVLATVAIIWGKVNRSRSPFVRTSQIQSLAVLPFANLSGNFEQDYLVDGVHEALLIELSKLAGLRRVTGRSSVMLYRKADKPPSQIARELGVDALVTGSILRSGDHVQIIAHLINGTTEQEIWADRYERDLRDLLSLQSDIVTAIARNIQLGLTTDEQRLLAQRPSLNLEAYDAYLKGRFFVSKGTAEGFERGFAYLHDAINKDPTNALAYSRLALAYTEAGHETLPDAFAQAKSAARKALELDSNSAEAYEVLAETKLYNDWDDWPGAEQNFQRALTLNPRLSVAHRNYSWYLHLMGRGDQALAEMEKAIEIDPMSPLMHEDLGYQFWDLHQEQRALDEQRRALGIDPSFPVAYWVLASIHGEMGRYAEAIAASEKAAQGDPELRWLLAVSYAHAGRKNAALSLAAEIKKQPSPMSEFGLATFYAGIGSREDAFAWLERSFQDRFSLLPWLSLRGTEVQRPFDPYWSDPRYQTLLGQMKLSPAGR